MHFGSLFSFNWPKSAKVWRQEPTGRVKHKIQKQNSPVRIF
tara:strand:+ start:1428 stop:1550 length:123 start_codon:yes stop_codon:yes gene_type:complete